MNVLFLTSSDLKESVYKREGNKNLLVTKFGTGDTFGICGKIIDIAETKFGVMITLKDKYDNIVVTAGTFNKNALNDAKNVLKKFLMQKQKEHKEIYLLLYVNPFYKDGKIYLNANQDFCIFEVDENTYNDFNNLREKSIRYIHKKSGKEKVKKESIEEKIHKEEYAGEADLYFTDLFPYTPSEIDIKISKFVKNLSKGKEIKISDVINALEKEKFLKDMNINIENKIYELIEKGYFYEPKQGYLKVI